MINWSHIELRILDAVNDGIIIDRRNTMPTGDGRWKVRAPSDIVGQCVHQSASMNVDKPVETALYHTGPNHISENGLPSICYCICITDTDDPPWLTVDFKYRTYSQGADDDQYPGDENKHLLAILVMGSFIAPGYRGKLSKPSERQMVHLSRVTDWAGDVFEYGPEGIFGHYHFGKATCPGSYLMNWVESLRGVARQLRTDEDWQKALCLAMPDALPLYGIDGQWGNESRRALIKFQRKYKLRVTGLQDAFTELMLMRVAKENKFENT